MAMNTASALFGRKRSDTIWHPREIYLEVLRKTNKIVQYNQLINGEKR